MNFRILLVGLCLAGSAHARDLNRQPYPLGERASGMGGAFIGMTGDAVSTFYNPAGLASIRSPGVSLSASAYQYGVETYAGEVVVGDFSADMDSATFSTFPASIVFAVPLGDKDAPTKHTAAFSVLVPDRDQLEARLDVKPADVQLEMNALVLQDDLTYWVGPSYAFETPTLRFGVSLFALVHQTRQQANIAIKLAFLNDAGEVQNNYAAAVQELSGFGATAVAQVGLQYLASPKWTLGATVRSPTFGRLYSDVKGVAFNSAYADDPQGNPRSDAANPAYVDRVELSDAELTYKLPLMAGIGAAYQDATYAFAIDARVHLAQPRYTLIDAEPNAPRAPDGSPIRDPDRVFEPDISRESKLVWNVNVGGEAVVSPDWKLRGGLFTDRSTQDLDFYDGSADARLEGISNPVINRYGVSFAVGRKSKETTTSVGLIYTFGTGEAWSLSELFTGGSATADVQSHLITAVLSGSADF